MKLLPYIFFLLPGILAFTSAQGVGNGFNEYEHQHSAPLEARIPPIDAQTVYSEYLTRGRRLWATLSRELATNSPDAPSGSAHMHQRWDFRASEVMITPSQQIIKPLQSLHLPYGPDYTRIDALTPKGMQNPTVSRFHSLFNVANGVILVEDMFRDEEKASQVADPATLGTEHWSQITVESWRLLCYSAATSSNHPDVPTHSLFANLRYIFMVMITSDETEAVINDMLMTRQPGRNGSPVQFLPNSNAFYVLLGSPNGQGLPYMLFQNKNAFRYKTIKSVTLQSITPGHFPEPWWHLWWEIG
ncbi:hypothetical protein MMC34_005059 [Xylographa carneopallida]|nr:hypothetical protein [Xylographa carneopallida]